jgi:hypothetical protein
VFIFSVAVSHVATIVYIRDVKKNRRTGTGKPETGKPASWFRFRFGKTKNRIPRFRYPVFGIWFLPGYQDRVKYIYFYFFSLLYILQIYIYFFISLHFFNYIYISLTLSFSPAYIHIYYTKKNVKKGIEVACFTFFLVKYLSLHFFS